MEQQQRSALGEKQYGRRLRQLAMLVVVLCTFLCGAYLGTTRWVGSGAAAQSESATPDALSESERDELNRLRTAVAELSPCATPIAENAQGEDTAPAPIVTVPPGVAIETYNHWTVQVEGFSPSTPIDGATPDGQFLQVVIKVSNNEAKSRTFGLTNWVLVDQQGNTYKLHHLGTTQKSSPTWYTELDPSTEYTFTVVYDVKIGAGPSFTFVSKNDPTLQFPLTLKVLG